MTAREVNLDRVSLDGFAVRRLSATLRLGGGDRPETRESPNRISPRRPEVGRRKARFAKSVATT